MKRTTFDETRDQRIANETMAERSLMCAARGCPNRWAVDAGKGKLCSAHAWADAAEWPLITEQQLWDETERARIAADETKPPLAPRRPPSEAERRALRAGAQLVGAPKADPKAWAAALQHRDESGEPLTVAQRAMWRAAAPKPQVEEDRWE